MHSLTERQQERISIHALREEGDVVPHAKVVLGSISIHALREEGDCWVSEIRPM